jgi:hypothetical protein
MANAIDFAGSNRKLLPPQGAENVEALHTYTNGMCSVSCWELTQEELAEVIRTGRVFLTVLSGTCVCRKRRYHAFVRCRLRRRVGAWEGGFG